MSPESAEQWLWLPACLLLSLGLVAVIAAVWAIRERIQDGMGVGFLGVLGLVCALVLAGFFGYIVFFGLPS